MIKCYFAKQHLVLKNNPKFSNTEDKNSELVQSNCFLQYIWGNEEDNSFSDRWIYRRVRSIL